MKEKENNQLVIYRTSNGEIKVNVEVQNDTVWLSLNQISALFERDKSVISRHLNNIFKEGELEQKATVANFATVQQEGERRVEREIEYYNLDAILSVGYRVNSKVGTEFRRWASKILKEYLIKGYSINKDKMLQSCLIELQQTVELLSNTLIEQNLVNDTGAELLSLVRSYSKTWNILINYDENNLSIPSNLSNLYENLLSYQESSNAIITLKEELQESNGLFGLERGDGIKAILANIDQTFDSKPLYHSEQEKAANLLYFVIKDHPFTDGNKRIGSLLFLLYLSKAKITLENLGSSSMTALALLIAQSDPAQKELMIKLIINLIN